MREKKKKKADGTRACTRGRMAQRKVVKAERSGEPPKQW